jgi:hypothetical protein
MISMPRPTRHLVHEPTREVVRRHGVDLGEEEHQRRARDRQRRGGGGPITLAEHREDAEHDDGAVDRLAEALNANVVQLLHGTRVASVGRQTRCVRRPVRTPAPTRRLMLNIVVL